MSIAKDKIPKSEFKGVSEIIKLALDYAEKALSGKPVDDQKGPFSEPIELFASEILRASDEDASNLKVSKEVHEKLSFLLRDTLQDVNLEDYLQCATLALYGYLVGNYNEEDFRVVYRYSLQNVQDKISVEKWLRRALVLLSACENTSIREVMSGIRYWIRFLGSPLPSPRVYVDICNEFGFDIEDLFGEEDYRLIDTLRRHPNYSKEAIGEKDYRELWTQTKEWLPDVHSSKILDLVRRRIYKESQKKLKEDSSVSQAYKTVRDHFEKTGFGTADGSVLPVRLQELPQPPPAEAIDPEVFEMIPQKLRVGLMPSVYYYSKPKTIEIHFLGGKRIGRSGILIKTDTGAILMDFGLSVANQRIPEWIPELEMIDTVLISHAHLDHVGGLPVLYERYSGKWCSTAKTGGITKILLDDALKVGTPLPPRKRDKWDFISRFKQTNVDKVSKNHVMLEVGKSNEVAPGIVVTPIDACHIPGSVAYLIDIEGKKILYTGDFNIDKSILFDGASLPTETDVVIFDGTYWGREDFDRTQVAQTLSDTISNYGPVVIPSFAVGRSQEILLMLEEIGATKWKNVMVAGMAENVTKLVGVTGKWTGMKKNKVALDQDDVLVAGSGMMSGGLARHHFKEHRDNPNAAVILCGYLAPRTPGWNLMHGYEPHKCQVVKARLSAHSSASNLQEYISACKGQKVMVHTPFEGKAKNLFTPEITDRIILKI